MRILKVVLIVALCVTLLTSCASRIAGTYQADARLVEGQQESTEPGYSLAEVKEKLRSAPRILTLNANGRYVWNTGPAKNEGIWRVEQNTLILRDDISNGIRIQPVLQSDRKWYIDPRGDIVDPNIYGHYNIEVVYQQQ